MSDPIPSSSESKVNSKPEVVQKIAGSLQAKKQFDQIHGVWQENAKIAAETGSQIPEEPTASPDAFRGQTLIQAKNKVSKKVEACFDSNLPSKKNVSKEKRTQNLNDKINKIIEEINDNPDQELKIIQVAGALNAISNRISPTKWELTSHLLDIAPESLNFCELPNNFESYYLIQGSNYESPSDLEAKFVQNVLKHLSSESSPISPQSKEKYQLYIEENKGTEAFKTLFSQRYNRTDAVLTAEQIISAFGLENQITTEDIKQVEETLYDQISLTPNANPNFNARTLSFGHNFISSIENVPMILSRLVQKKPELASIVIGKEIGYCKSLLKNRPNVTDPRFGKNEDMFYSQLTHKVAESLMNLYDLEKTDFLMDIVQLSNYNTSVIDKEISSLFLENGLRIPSVNDKINSQHLELTKKANAAKQRQENETLQAKLEVEAIKNAEKQAVAKKDQEQTIKLFLENKAFRDVISSLVSEKEIFLNNSKLENINKEFDSLVKNNPDLKSVAEFAKKIAFQYIRYVKDPSFATESIGTVQENFGPFKLLKRDRTATIFKVDLVKVNEIRKQILESDNLHFDPDNQIKVQALTFLSRRNGKHTI